MDIVVRAIAIFIELIILFAMFFFILSGVRLILFDLGVTQKYSKILTMILIAVGCVLAAFFISHLTTFYPPVSGG
jgi:succinate dehydrogenase/fumarate reductase cytochrome b subunit